MHLVADPAEQVLHVSTLVVFATRQPGDNLTRGFMGVPPREAESFQTDNVACREAGSTLRSVACSSLSKLCSRSQPHAGSKYCFHLESSSEQNSGLVSREKKKCRDSHDDY